MCCSPRECPSSCTATCVDSTISHNVADQLHYIGSRIQIEVLRVHGSVLFRFNMIKYITINSNFLYYIKKTVVESKLLLLGQGLKLKPFPYLKS